MGSHITLSDIGRVKKLAKQAKKNGAEGPHGTLLDKFSMQEYGVRHFHELRVLQANSFARYLSSNGGATRCRYCDLLFYSTFEKDVKHHCALHEQYEQAHALVGFLPSKYEERERIKRLGYEWLYSESDQVRRDGALAILLSHFDRSLASAIADGRWRHHPIFDVYIRHAVSTAVYLPHDVREWLAAEFGEPAGVVDISNTYWPVSAKGEYSISERSGELRNAVLGSVNVIPA